MSPAVAQWIMLQEANMVALARGILPSEAFWLGHEAMERFLELPEEERKYLNRVFRQYQADQNLGRRRLRP